MSDSRRREGPAEWTLGERYRVGREIGRGSYGVVHRALDLRSGRDIALKLVDLERDNGPEDAATERIGADLQQRFGRVHPGFVPEVFEHGEIRGYYAIAMELIEAPSLNQTVIRSGPLSAERAAAIALGIARFLDRARRFSAVLPHEGHGGLSPSGTPASEQIVHGDLKPQHIKLLPDGTIRVLDFGIAHGLSTSRTSATARGTSTHYASPELLETGRVRPQDDCWALGIILFEVLAGVVPYHRYTLQPSLERAIRTGAPRDSLPPGTDPVLAAIVEKLLRPQPERRYPSAAAIARDLGAFLDGEPTIAETEAATVATVRAPAAHADPSPAAGFDVPTLPIPRPAAPPSVSGAVAPNHAAPAPQAPAALVPPRPGRMPWRRRGLLVFGVPMGLAMLMGMCSNDGPPPHFPIDRPAVQAAPPLNMEFARIGPGTFTMGCPDSDDECESAEQPAHGVRLTRGFEIGKYEVTRTQWAAVLAGGRRPDDGREPVIAHWGEVQEFLGRLNSRADGYEYRLPTEAEWEYTARAGTEAPSGRDLSDMRVQPNPWGVYDMLGGVSEWVQDWYGPYEDRRVVDPVGPPEGQFRVIRGVDDSESGSHVATRRTQADLNDLSGFRIVREPAREREAR